MIFRANNMRRVFVGALLLSLAAVVEAKPLYRYRNAEGVVVVGYQVPTDSVGGGYEVLNDKGMVIKVVPRELTAEERKAKDAEEKREQEARAEQERLRAWDESLLLHYSTVADIEDAQRRALGDLQIRMSILRGNRRSIKQTVENYQAQAADTERAGKSVDVERLRTIERLQDEIATIERDILDRQQEIEELSASFQADIERFGMLQDVVKLRQTLRPRGTKKPPKPP
jgi:chromosome segregation ATPase